MLPARQSYFFCLYLSNTASLDLSLDAGEVLPARQPYLSNLLRNEAYPSDTAILKPQSDVGESLRTDKLSFSILRPARPTRPRCRSTARPSDHLTLPFCLNPSDSGSPDLPTDAGESSPGQTISSFQVHARRGLPVRHGDY